MPNKHDDDFGFSGGDNKATNHLAKAISTLACAIDELGKQRKEELDWLKSTAGFVTKCDLGKTEENIVMKLSEVKAIVNQSAGETKEALGEIGTKVADLQKQIDDLIAGNSDPEVTDEVFLTNLNQLKTDTAALAAIVPPVVVPPPDPAARGGR